jgi:hypothetical protein
MVRTCKLIIRAKGPRLTSSAAGVGGGYNIDSAFNAWANEDGTSHHSHIPQTDK